MATIASSVAIEAIDEILEINRSRRKRRILFGTDI
jgi:hypothetical protein